MARAKRKLPAKPAGFVFPQHRDHFCPVIRYPNTKPPPPTIHTPQKPHGPIKRHRPTPEHKKPAAAPNTAGRFHFSALPRSLLPRHPIPEHKAPAADNTHPTKTSRPDQTAPTDARTQKTRCRSEHRRPLSFLRSTAVTSAAVNRLPNTKNPLPLRTPPAAFISPHYRGHFCPVIRYPNTKPPPPTIHTPQKPHGPVKRHRPMPEHKKTRCRSEHRRPFPLSLKKPQRCLNAIVQRQPPPAGAQHHLTQPNPNISGRRFTAFFALRCL